VRSAAEILCIFFFKNIKIAAEKALTFIKTTKQENLEV
jgi:hypothetical protein